MKKSNCIFVLFCFIFLKILAQNSNTSLPLNVQTFMNAPKSIDTKDSVYYKMPIYKQGFFCTFEDMLNRRKVPVDFSLGNSKY